MEGHRLILDEFGDHVETDILGAHLPPDFLNGGVRRVTTWQDLGLSRKESLKVHWLPFSIISTGQFNFL